jgi:hypothetical protein
MGVNRTAAQIRALREELIAQGAAEERQRIESDKDKDAEEKLQADQAECTKEHDSAYEALNKDQAEYDKQLLTLSAGFLVFSLAFIKDIVPLNHAAHLWALYSAFTLIGSCVWLVLISYQYSIHGQIRLAKYWELRGEALSAETEKKREIDASLRRLWSQIDRHARHVRRLNLLSGGLFLVGVGFLVGFVISNISRQVHMPSTEIGSGAAAAHTEQLPLPPVSPCAGASIPKLPIEPGLVPKGPPKPGSVPKVPPPPPPPPPTNP